MIAPRSSARCSGWLTSSKAIKANRRERSGPQRESKRSRRTRGHTRGQIELLSILSLTHDNGCQPSDCVRGASFEHAMGAGSGATELAIRQKATCTGDRPLMPAFRSTPPRRRRRANGVRDAGWLYVSIHAPAKEATKSVEQAQSYTVFRSTPPRRRRPADSSAIISAVSFRSTPPRRRRQKLPTQPPL